MPTDDGSRRGRRGTRLAPVFAWVAAAVTVVVLAVFFIQAGSFKALQPPDETPAEQPAPQQITASRSTITGFDKQNEPYEIAADNAVQDADTPNLVHLNQVSGQLKKTDGNILDMRADLGIYNTKTKVLDMTGNVRVVSKNRFTATLEKATVIVEEKRLTSAAPVEVNFSGGKIIANGVEITNNGNDIRFTNGVRTTFARSGSKEDNKQ